MKKILILCLFLVSGISVWAQTQPDFRPLRYNDDFTYIKTDTTQSLYDKIKYIPLSKSGKYYGSIGGEARLQYIFTKNNKWGDEPDDPDGYLLSRYLFHTDIHLGMFRLFGQFQSSIASSMPDPSPVDENTADIHQAFLDINFINNEQTKLFTRLGRQEMYYGSQRLISVREGPNNRLAMDGFKAVVAKKDFQADAFYMHPVANVPGSFNDKLNESAKLWGAYTVLNNIKILHNIDLYYLGLWKKNTNLDNVTGEELRHTVGTRIWKNKGNWKYDLEALYQFGRLADMDISAWSVSSYVNYEFSTVKFEPVIGLKTEIISGDANRNDKKLQTLNPLYPRGGYFGLVAMIGPSNLFDIHPSIDMSLTKKLSFGMDYDIFWRWSDNDGLYAPNMQLLYSGEGIAETFVGTQLVGDFEYAFNPFFSLTVEGAWFNAGAFLKEAGTGKDYYYAAFTATFRF
ncbi:alginate export family protein [Flavobacterium hauense]